MIIKEITYYIQDRLSEYQSMQLWEELIIDEEAFSIFKMYMMLREYYADSELT